MMKYKDLLRKSKELFDDQLSTENVSRKEHEKTQTGGKMARRMRGKSPGESSGEERFDSASLVGENDKEHEIEKIFSKMEKFMSFGHNPLSIDEGEGQQTLISTLLKETVQGKGVRPGCSAPQDNGTKCWDLNQQIGTKTFEECFECPVFQGSEGLDGLGAESSARESKDRGKKQRDGAFMYESFVTSIKGLYQDAKKRKKIELDIAGNISSKLRQKVPKDNTLLWHAINARKGSEIASHVLNVAIFSVKVGIGLKYSPDELQLLATAAVLHDVGMTAIPSSIIQKKSKLTRHEYDLIKQHPLYSMEILRNSVSGDSIPVFDRLIRIVGEEHERENGKGYPNGKKSDEIDELAKVIGVLDVFEALSHDREHRSEHSSFQAIQVIIQMRNDFFSTKVVKAMITEISIFPLESYVMLNNREVGRVVKTNYAHPMRPVIEIIRDSKGKKVKKKEVDLSSSPLIFITRPVGEEEL